MLYVVQNVVQASDFDAVLEMVAVVEQVGDEMVELLVPGEIEDHGPEEARRVEHVVVARLIYVLVDAVRYPQKVRIVRLEAHARLVEHDQVVLTLQAFLSSCLFVVVVSVPIANNTTSIYLYF